MRNKTILLTDRGLCIIWLLLLSACTVLAQTSGAVNPNKWDLSFSKQNITWDWRGRYYYADETRDGIRFRIRDNFTSNLIKSGEGRQPWRDEHKLKAFFYQPFGKSALGLYADSWFLSDQQSRGTSRYSNHALGARWEYGNKKEYLLAPYAGYQRSEYLSRIEWGWDVGLRGNVNNYRLGDYRADVNIESNYDFYQQRRNAANEIDVHLKANFSAFARDSLVLMFGSDKKQYFSPDNDFLVDLQIENRGLFNKLNYRLSRNQNLELNTLLTQRRIDDNSPAARNQRKVDKFENRLNYYLTGGKTGLMLGLHTFQENQDNLGIRTDSKARQTALLANLNFHFDPQNDLNIQLSYVKFQYDTPDSITNNDDRDEQRFLASINYTRRFSPAFKTSIEAYANFYHQIYIFKEQSANNNWNRILRLKAEAQYNHQRWRNNLQTEVLANYTVYDFEDQFTNTRSFIFRKYIVSDSLEIPLLNRTALGLFARAELEDKGSFFKKEFLQRILQSTESFFYDAYLSIDRIYYFNADGGVSVYMRKDWQHVPRKKIIRDIRTITPYIRLKYRMTRNLRFHAYAAITYQENKLQPQADYITGRINIVYTF